MKNKEKGFTLIELLVVVLIIGILAVIAFPKYQKMILKANLHKGVVLVESLYQAQQHHFLATGTFAQDLNDLIISAPLGGCTKENISNASSYKCDFGTISINRDFYSINYTEPSQRLVYAHNFRDQPVSNITLRKDKRYCWAKLNDTAANSICQSLGTEWVGRVYWEYYEFK